MKVFCTGASGYIGGSVAAHFVAAGHQVTGLVRSQEKADAVRRFGIEPVMGTLDDAAVLRKQRKPPTSCWRTPPTRGRWPPHSSAPTVARRRSSTATCATTTLPATSSS